MLCSGWTGSCSCGHCFNELCCVQGGLVAALVAIDNQDLFTGVIFSSAGVEVDPNVAGPVLVSYLVLSSIVSGVIGEYLFFRNFLLRCWHLFCLKLVLKLWIQD